MENSRSLYDVLGVLPHATPSQISEIYLHKREDMLDSLGRCPESAGKLRELSIAYSILSNPELKARYDAGEKVSGRWLTSLEGEGSAAGSGSVPSAASPIALRKHRKENCGYLHPVSSGAPKPSTGENGAHTRETGSSRREAHGHEDNPDALIDGQCEIGCNAGKPSSSSVASGESRESEDAQVIAFPTPKSMGKGDFLRRTAHTSWMRSIPKGAQEHELVVLEDSLPIKLRKVEDADIWKLFELACADPSGTIEPIFGLRVIERILESIILYCSTASTELELLFAGSSDEQMKIAIGNRLVEQADDAEELLYVFGLNIHKRVCDAAEEKLLGLIANPKENISAWILESITLSPSFGDNARIAAGRRYIDVVNASALVVFCAHKRKCEDGDPGRPHLLDEIADKAEEKILRTITNPSDKSSDRALFGIAGCDFLGNPVRLAAEKEFFRKASVSELVYAHSNAKKCLPHFLPRVEMALGAKLGGGKAFLTYTDANAILSNEHCGGHLKELVTSAFVDNSGSKSLLIVATGSDTAYPLRVAAGKRAICMISNEPQLQAICRSQDIPEEVKGCASSKLRALKMGAKQGGNNAGLQTPLGKEFPRKSGKPILGQDKGNNPSARTPRTHILHKYALPRRTPRS